jgi:uncharacterized membrane protein
MSPKTLTIIALILVLVTLAAIEINAICHRRVDATISDVMREWNVLWGGLVCIGWLGTPGLTAEAELENSKCP